MDSRSNSSRGLAEILGVQENNQPVQVVSKLQILSQSSKKVEGKLNQNGWIKQQVTMFEEQVRRLILKINWLQESLQQEYSNRDQQLECLQQMVLEQAGNLERVSHRVDRCFQEIETLQSHWETMQARLGMEHVERLRVEAMLRDAWKLFPQFLSNRFEWQHIEHVGGQNSGFFFSQWVFQGDLMQVNYAVKLLSMSNNEQRSLRLQEVASSSSRVVKHNRQIKHKVKFQGKTNMQRRLTRLYRLANNRAQFLKQERRQRLEAERKLDDLSASMLKESHVKATQAPEECDNLVEQGNTSLTLWDGNIGQQQGGQVQPIVKSKISSLANRILRLKGTTGRLVKDLEGAYSMNLEVPRRQCLHRITTVSDTGLEQQGRIVDFKSRLKTMEEQLHYLEGMAFDKTRDLEQRLCAAFEARLTCLDQQKWTLRKRLQEKAMEVKQERMKRQEAEVQVRLLQVQNSGASHSDKEEFKTLRAEVDKISARVMEAIQDVEREHEEHIKTCRLSSEVSRHRDIVWRQGILAFEQALLLCVAAFLVFSRALYSPLAPPPT